MKKLIALTALLAFGGLAATAAIDTKDGQKAECKDKACCKDKDACKDKKGETKSEKKG